MKKCNGCGAVLQNNDKDILGFAPDLDKDLCQRCFRIKHYDDLVKSYKSDFDNFDILETVNKEDNLVIWVVDLFDFDSNIINGLNRHLLNKDIILVGTKRDLLPNTMGNGKLLEFVRSRLNFYGISVSEILFTGHHGHDGKEQVLKVIDHYREDRDVIIMGQANVGKSTLINALAESDITISRYPGTTLDLISISMDGYTLFDTPGLIRTDNMQYYIDNDNLNKVVPKKIKPKVFQLSKSASFTIEGIAQVQIEVHEKTSVIFYVNDQLNIHRTSLDKADDQWEREFNEQDNVKAAGSYKLTKDLPVTKDPFDIVINGLGFINCKRNIKAVRVLRNENVEVLIREAII